MQRPLLVASYQYCWALILQIARQAGNFSDVSVQQVVFMTVSGATKNHCFTTDYTDSDVIMGMIKQYPQQTL